MPFNTVNYVDVNNIKAATAIHGDFFWDPATLNPSCEFPKGSAKHATAVSAVWMSGYDRTNKLHVSAQTYRQDGNDFWPGPIDSAGQLSYANSQLWNRIWKVYKADIVQFHLQSTHTIANTPLEILQWPAKNNPNATGYNNAPLTIGNRDMAPFIDVNGDGKYNALDGDYPDIKGDEMLWWVFSDNGPTHDNHSITTAASTALKIEVHATAYAFTRNTLIDNVVYHEYTLYNRSANNYTNFRFAIHSEADLGYYNDDMLGFDSSHRMGIVYNGNTIDGIGASINEYHDSPPVSGLTFIHTPGDNGASIQPAGSFMYVNSNFTVSGSPACDTEYNNYMRSKFRDGMHLKNDFTGQGINTTGRGAGPEADYVFPGEVDDPAQWSSCKSNNNASDVRFVLATGDYTFNAGAVTKLAFAFVVTDTNYHTACGNMNYGDIKQVADTAWANYTYIPPTSIPVAGTNMSRSLSLYPNPVHDIAYLNIPNAPANVDISVYDVTGRRMPAQVHVEQARISINMSEIPPGVYNIVCNLGNNRQTNLFIKN